MSSIPPKCSNLKNYTVCEKSYNSVALPAQNSPTSPYPFFHIFFQPFPTLMLLKTEPPVFYNIKKIYENLFIYFNLFQMKLSTNL